MWMGSCCLLSLCGAATPLLRLRNEWLGTQTSDMCGYSGDGGHRYNQMKGIRAEFGRAQAQESLPEGWSAPLCFAHKHLCRPERCLGLLTQHVSMETSCLGMIEETMATGD